jgi:hypothetical protein
MTAALQDERFLKWLTALETRHLADFRVAEVTRALRALSSAYVQRRQKLAAGAALDSKGKRAAFALFYGPLHMLTVSHIVRAIGADVPAPGEILDLGCGTGVGGAAWALSSGGSPRIVGIDRHPWAVDESRWTYRELGLRGNARIGDLARLPPAGASTAVVAAYTLNELPEERRRRLLTYFVNAASLGARVLVVEPIASAVTPWWDDVAADVTAMGGREDKWRFPVELPPLIRLLDKAAGLDHQLLTARSLYLSGRPAQP